MSVSEKRSESGVSSQLSIVHTERHDSGVYRCRAENAYGRDELLIYLAVQGELILISVTDLLLISTYFPVAVHYHIPINCRILHYIIIKRTTSLLSAYTSVHPHNRENTGDI